MNTIIRKFICIAAGLLACLGLAQSAAAGGREEARLLTATQVLDEIEGMPDQRVPDYLLERAYGIAVIPDVTKVAFVLGGRRGSGVLVVRDTLNAPWSNPVLVSLTGGSVGFQAGAQNSDVILVFTTKAGVEGLAGGKLTLGADASVAAGPVGRQGSAATDIQFNSEIYSYARTRGLFGGIALDGSVISINHSANAALYGKSNVTTTEILSAQSPKAPPAAQRFLERIAQATNNSGQAQAAAQTSVSPAAAAPASGTAPAAGSSERARTYPLESQPMAGEAQPH
jgi:lipid-binding SYLF domain-containing protein